MRKNAFIEFCNILNNASQETCFAPLLRRVNSDNSLGPGLFGQYSTRFRSHLNEVLHIGDDGIHSPASLKDIMNIDSNSELQDHFERAFRHANAVKAEIADFKRDFAEGISQSCKHFPVWVF